MTSTSKVILVVIGILVLGTIVFFTMTPVGRTIWNNYMHDLNKADERNYEKRKQVEDTARSMIASYVKDKTTYNQYKDSDNPEKQGWAEQAKMRANQTAAVYNEYILKNSYVWEDNIPANIYTSLDFID